MNVLLEKYFEKYELSDKDRYEINQIFQLLPPEKKQNVLDNFDNIISNILNLQENIKLEQEILVWDAVSKIRNAIEIAKLEKNLS